MIFSRDRCSDKETWFLSIVLREVLFGRKFIQPKIRGKVFLIHALQDFFE